MTLAFADAADIHLQRVSYAKNFFHDFVWNGTQ